MLLYDTNGLSTKKPNHEKYGEHQRMTKVSFCIPFQYPKQNMYVCDWIIQFT